MGKFLFRLRLFMQNRYGADQLYYALMVLYLILLVLHIALMRITGVGSRIINIISWAVLIYAFYRVFSRNIEKRNRENAAFLHLLGKASSGNISNPFDQMSASFSQAQEYASDRKDKKYVKCPKCKATLRVPRQKGKHTVRCPRCNNRFQIRIFFGKK